MYMIGKRLGQAFHTEHLSPPIRHLASSEWKTEKTTVLNKFIKEEPLLSRKSWEDNGVCQWIYYRQLSCWCLVNVTKVIVSSVVPVEETIVFDGNIYKRVFLCFIFYDCVLSWPAGKAMVFDNSVRPAEKTAVSDKFITNHCLVTSPPTNCLCNLLGSPCLGSHCDRLTANETHGLFRMVNKAWGALNYLTYLHSSSFKKMKRE